ncbi:hypothetical protein Tco_0304908 [Tanacetum coccineum]|uniref:DUF4283 domain-containing protein n=1 Tax=Tanacetum coccineum TaxID=301880 RepID=A0ABQ4ZEF9_9ASTR
MNEDVCNVLVWVSFHDFLITSLTKDVLSSIVTKLGTTLMLDSYKTNMCLGSWGGSSYARAMIELRVEVELKDTQVVDIAKFKGERYTRSTIRIEYEYQPPRCLTCKVFGHVLDECLKKILLDVPKNLRMPRQVARRTSGGFKA